MNIIKTIFRILIIAIIALIAISSPSQWIAQGQDIDDIIGPKPFSCDSVTEVPLPECAALIALYKTTGGSQWEDNTGWLSSKMPCSWYGVTCSEGSVTELHLAGEIEGHFGLQGNIPPTISNFSNLTVLALSYNQLSNIPDEIGDLSNLEVLSLDHNQLSTIPTQIGALSNLVTLALSYNRLTTIPYEISRLSNLNTLTLSSNQLSSLPSDLAKLTGLVEFEIDHNQIMEAGSELQEFLDEKIPHWSGSQYELYPSEFSCTKVRQIPQAECDILLALYNSTDGPNWSDNTDWLVTTTPCTWDRIICNNGHIVTLQLDSLGLQNSIPSEIGNMSDLITLDISGNELMALPVEIGNLAQLRILDISSNQFTMIPAEIGRLDRLSILHVSDNQLSDIPSEIGNLQNLTSLNLSSNQLTTVATVLENLNNLISLNLSRNQLDSMPLGIGSLSNLTSLNLSQNQLDFIPTEIGDLDKLNSLLLNNNQLVNIPDEIGKLNYLTALDLSDNQLNSLPASIIGLSNLTRLILDYNQLSNLPIEINQLSDLTELNVGYNRLQINNSNLRKFLATEDSNWEMTQTVPPDNLSVTALSDTLLQLQWMPILYSGSQSSGMGIGHYEISYATLENGPYEVHGTTSHKNNIRYDLTDLDPNTTYYLRVRTRSIKYWGAPDETWSEYSEAVSATTLDNPPQTPIVTPTPLPTRTPTNTPTRTPTNTPTRTPTNTPLPTPTNTLPPTPTNTLSPTVTTMPTRTATDIPSPTPTATSTIVSDQSEPHDRCNQANSITANGSFHQAAFETSTDLDWFMFQAIADEAYRIEVEVPSSSSADVNLELYPDCEVGPADNWLESFTPSVQLDFTPSISGPIYLRLENDHDESGPHVEYQLTVRKLNEETHTGAVIIVAGRLKERDPLQDNIHAMTDEVFAMFQERGYPADRIYYLATERVSGYDAAATVSNLRWAVTQWTQDVVAPADIPDVLTLYIMDHGDIDLLYLDEPRGERLQPDDLDEWLDTLEAAVPGIKINVIIEACHAGSFIQTPNSISGPGRVIITSSDQENKAYASSDGAYFSDQLLTALREGDNLYSSWWRGSDVVTELFPFSRQRPWLDGNGNGLHNEPEDFVEASRRGFAYSGTLDTADKLWPPYIARVTAPDDFDGRSGTITAEVRDDKNVSHVWAVIYPPSYIPPEGDGVELVDEDLEKILLDDKGDNIYRGRYSNFTETGKYRIVFHADDGDNLTARPVVTEFNLSSPLAESRNIYLPLITR